MSCRAGFLWDSPQHFSRLIEDCGIVCEIVTPHMLAAPFFRGSFNCLIVPTGFGNAKYSNLLPALRASSSRIRRFVENGGNLLVFGAADNKADAYDWLPFRVRYSHEFHPRNITFSGKSLSATIVDEYDPANIECDGSFPEHEGTCVGAEGTSDVIIEHMYRKGKIIVTSIHEFPSRNFLTQFCCDGEMTTF
ncbi:MAG: hypothetical protein LUQ71_05085 [Methanoregula sp.]|nr:hypothetical protein [Methanoregula sp.]